MSFGSASQHACTSLNSADLTVAIVKIIGMLLPHLLFGTMQNMRPARPLQRTGLPYYLLLANI